MSARPHTASIASTTRDACAARWREASGLEGKNFIQRSRNRTNPASQIPKSEIANWTVQLEIGQFRDLRCAKRKRDSAQPQEKIRPISRCSPSNSKLVPQGELHFAGRCRLLKFTECQGRRQCEAGVGEVHSVERVKRFRPE